MIVAETAGGYQFVSQPDHAALAGQFAERWGGGDFDRPSPFPAAVAAAYTHDDGWADYDRRPHLGPDGTPLGFTELPAATWIDLYDWGIEAVADLDPYAGILVSMHGTGLRRRRYGLSPAWPATPPAFEDFVDRQERNQRERLDALLAERDDRVGPADVDLLEALHETGSPPPTTRSRLWTNYALLQVWDSLSLSCCTVVSPPASPELRSVPTGPGGPGATLALDRTEDGALTVEPYPFVTEPARVQVPVRTVDRDAFDDERSLLEAYYTAGYDVRTFRFRSVARPP